MLAFNYILKHPADLEQHIVVPYSLEVFISSISLIIIKILIIILIILLMIITIIIITIIIISGRYPIFLLF